MSPCGRVQLFILIAVFGMAQSARKLGDLEIENTAFFLCDMQEFFKPAVKNFAGVEEVGSKKMIAAANIYKIPLYVSEHEPTIYGSTVKSLTLGDNSFVYQKDTFSMWTPELKEKIKKSGRKIETIVIFGVETHICIEQTVIDLIKEGFEVHVVADGVSSRSLMDRTLALQRFQLLGAFVESSESCLYKLLKTTQHASNQAITDLLLTPLPEEFGKA